MSFQGPASPHIARNFVARVKESLKISLSDFNYLVPISRDCAFRGLVLAEGPRRGPRPVHPPRSVHPLYVRSNMCTSLADDYRRCASGDSFGFEAIHLKTAHVLTNQGCSSIRPFEAYLYIVKLEALYVTAEEPVCRRSARDDVWGVRIYAVALSYFRNR